MTDLLESAKTILDFFWDLASLDQETRVKAAAGLLSTLQKVSAVYFTLRIDLEFLPSARSTLLFACSF
jgi:hypothetical protein